jgi:hydrophobic/amphiphilic exporter-1 (mainly G- bacteria), HAE1 family
MDRTLVTGKADWAPGVHDFRSFHHLVFLVLAAQYESWTDPAAVILVVPMALVGIAIGLFVRKLPDDLYTQIGLVLMIALAAKNAILIVEFARVLKGERMSPADAAVAAARRRFPPIIMTSIAFIFGVVPLVTADGAGAPASNPSAPWCSAE